MNDERREEIVEQAVKENACFHEGECPDNCIMDCRSAKAVARQALHMAIPPDCRVVEVADLRKVEWVMSRFAAMYRDGDPVELYQDAEIRDKTAIAYCLLANAIEEVA